MTIRRLFMISSVFGFCATVGVFSAAEQEQQLVLFAFDKNFDPNAVVCADSRVKLAEDNWLRVETGHSQPWPGITLKAPSGKWDLSKYEWVSLELRNLTDEPLTVNCRVDNPGADGTNNCVTDSISLNPQQSSTLTVRIFPCPWRLSKPLELVGMRGYPVHSGKLDPANITQLLVFVSKPQKDHAFAIRNIRAGGAVQTVDADKFFPFIDQFGQYVHRDWLGKTSSVKDLQAQHKAELLDLTTHQGPPNWNKFGGWNGGPKLSATGSFRVQKYLGKWWLVDPEGCLFWSHGIDCVHAGQPTPITDREHYFSELPKSNSEFAKFYGLANWAPHGYYKDHAPYKTYDFAQANLLHKHDQQWQKAFAEVTQRRLRSWGMNTIANWSDSEIYLMRRTPYVSTISFDSRKLEGSEGYWGKFYDVFDPQFAQELRRRLESEKEDTANDPWCVGYFVHNELSWDDEVSLAVATLMSPAEQPAKKVFVEDLKAKYQTIDKLNAAWKTQYAGWDDVLQRQLAPDKKLAWEDLTAFYTKTAETYFQTIYRELKKVAPVKMYLGCRFAWGNDRAIRAAAKFCDVVSFNRYTYSVQDLQLPADVDKPVIIGEFHFGALDRGMFHTGLKSTTDQNDRAEKYKSYVRGALKNPYIVGTHWFQYKDQPTTGRGDGENYQIGFVDICDRPYPEIIEASREVGYNLYEYRLVGN
jgi:hypothetical protein